MINGWPTMGSNRRPLPSLCGAGAPARASLPVLPTRARAPAPHSTRFHELQQPFFHRRPLRRHDRIAHRIAGDVNPRPSGGHGESLRTGRRCVRARRGTAGSASPCESRRGAPATPRRHASASAAWPRCWLRSGWPRESARCSRSRRRREHRARAMGWPCGQDHRSMFQKRVEPRHYIVIRAHDRERHGAAGVPPR